MLRYKILLCGTHGKSYKVEDTGDKTVETLNVIIKFYV